MISKLIHVNKRSPSKLMNLHCFLWEASCCLEVKSVNPIFHITCAKQTIYLWTRDIVIHWFCTMYTRWRYMPYDIIIVLPSLESEHMFCFCFLGSFVFFVVMCYAIACYLRYHPCTSAYFIYTFSRKLATRKHRLILYKTRERTLSNE